MSKIVMSPDLALPADAVTQTFGILAMKRMGKSFTARRMAEQLLHASLQTVIVDPKGDWWGMRSSADGKHAGFPIVIFGGEHGDVPLEPGAGEVVAKLIVEERVSALLDLSLLRKAQVAGFMTAFMETLYRLKAREQFRTPVMLIIDEADLIAPQKPYHGEERMLGAAEDIVRRGGQRGIGCTMITQRAAVINKNVLTQVQVLVVLRTIGKKDRDALDEWIEVHGSTEQRRELMESIASLPKGDAWFWSPGWPTADGIFLRTHVSPIETFDSGATPEAGKRPAAPKMLADVDLDAVRRLMADTVERAKQDDPKALRAELARLRAEFAKAPKSVPSPAPKVEAKRIEVPVLSEAQIRRLEDTLKRTNEQVREAFTRFAERVTAAYAPVAAKLGALSTLSPPRPASAPRAPSLPRAIVAPRTSRPTPVADGDHIPPARQRILDSLAWYEAMGIAAPSREAVAAIAKTSASGGSFRNNVSALHVAGLLAYPTDGALSLTDDGRARAVPPDLEPTAASVQQAVLGRLPPAKRSILSALIASYPDALGRDQLAEAVGTSAAGGSFRNNVSALRTLGALDYPSEGLVVATEMLFPVSA